MHNQGLNKLGGHPVISPLAMVCTKTATVIKREASNAKEVQLQHVLAAYQEALLGNEVLSVHEAACHFIVPKTTLQKHINGQGCVLEFNSEKSWLGNAESKVIVKDLTYSAQQGFPYTKHHLCGRVNVVIQDKLGEGHAGKTSP